MKDVFELSHLHITQYHSHDNHRQQTGFMGEKIRQNKDSQYSGQGKYIQQVIGYHRAFDRIVEGIGSSETNRCTNKNNLDKFKQGLFGIFIPGTHTDKLKNQYRYQGANWISKEENIINPYFGDMMLTCGSVEEIINN